MAFAGLDTLTHKCGYTARTEELEINFYMKHFSLLLTH